MNIQIKPKETPIAPKTISLNDAMGKLMKFKYSDGGSTNKPSEQFTVFDEMICLSND